jgi:DNA topoisomerase I
MRTDSVNLAQEALAELRDYIGERYGKKYVPEAPRAFKTKAKNAQEAHEAIRPTSIRNLPKDIKAHLSADQAKLYELIWKRTIACQMAHALINQVAVDLSAGAGNLFRATGSTVAEPGFMRVYLEGRDDATGADDDEERMLPDMTEGQLVDLLAIRPEQHFTEPPPRYSEASLVKALEELGIGRPSTYASIISTLQEREYVLLEKKRFLPTDVGRIVNKFLTEHFTSYVDYDFTAKLEDELDAVSRGEATGFRCSSSSGSRSRSASTTPRRTSSAGRDAGEHRRGLPRVRRPAVQAARAQRLLHRLHQLSRVQVHRNLDEEKGEKEEPEIVEGRSCPECGSELAVKRGRYGKFIGCTAYPKCRHIEPLEKPVDTGVECPKCHVGTLQKKKSRRGKIFFSCSTYPKCDYAVWNQPLAEPCPQCGWPVLTLKVTKTKGAQKVCPQKECGYAAPADAAEVEAVDQAGT